MVIYGWIYAKRSELDVRLDVQNWTQRNILLDICIAGAHVMKVGYRLVILIYP